LGIYTREDFRNEYYERVIPYGWKVMERDPDNPANIWNLVQAYNTAGEYEKAIPHVEKVNGGKARIGNILERAGTIIRPCRSTS